MLSRCLYFKVIVEEKSEASSLLLQMHAMLCTKPHIQAISEIQCYNVSRNGLLKKKKNYMAGQDGSRDSQVFSKRFKCTNIPIQLDGGTL